MKQTISHFLECSGSKEVSSTPFRNKTLWFMFISLEKVGPDDLAIHCAAGYFKPVMEGFNIYETTNFNYNIQKALKSYYSFP